MSKNTILTMGHPILRQRAQAVSKILDPGTQALVQKMSQLVDTLPAGGLAAPQIGESVRILIFQIHPFTAERKGIEVIPPQILINPEITPLGTQCYEDWEACFSLPDLMGRVSRFERVAYKGFNEKGEEVSGEARGHHARTLQHELDHLDGILYIDRMKDLTTLLYRDQYENWLAGAL